jgi:outer membrane receptor protein involved in Fe transport
MAAASLNVPLTPGNTQVLDRLNQLDLSLSKSFHTGTKRLQARFDVFNSLNKAPVLVVRSSNFGTAAYLQPSSVLDGRTFRAGMQMQF